MLAVPGQPAARVNDYAGALTPDQWSRLEAQVKSYETGGRQIAVAIFPSLNGGSVEDISIETALKWKIGGKASSEGVLLTVFLKDRKLRIEVGYGLEGRLTDAMSARIIRELIAPRFRAGDVAGGLSAGLAEINKIVSGGQPSLPPEHTRVSDSEGGWTAFVPFLIFFVLFAVIAYFVKRRGGGGGFTGGAAGWVIGGGGGSSGASGRSSDSGGFSGVGGDFGGGGASGDW